MSGGTEYPKEILSGGTHLGGARFTRFSGMGLDEKRESHIGD